jgi:hypothetical protein
VELSARVSELWRGRDASTVLVRLLEVVPRGRVLFVFSPNALGREPPSELPLWGVLEAESKLLGSVMDVLSEVLQGWVVDHGWG